MTKPNSTSLKVDTIVVDLFLLSELFPTVTRPICKLEMNVFGGRHDYGRIKVKYFVIKPLSRPSFSFVRSNSLQQPDRYGSLSDDIRSFSLSSTRVTTHGPQGR